MSADAINQTSNAATYHRVYRVSYSAFNFNGALSDEFRDWIFRPGDENSRGIRR